MIKVLIVDDSLVQQELLTYILNSDPHIKVIGTAVDGEDAIRKVVQLKPDLVTMDINMPKMNGVEAIRSIMSTHPLPIVVISGSSTKTELSNSFQAIEAGAVWVIERTTFTPESMKSLLNTVKLMSEIKVVKRNARLHKSKGDTVLNNTSSIPRVNIIAIGASMGGPVALQNIFKNLNKEFPPVLVVQHISAGFLQGLSDWLSQSANVTIKIAVHNDELKPNCIYFAPDAHQMGINSQNRIALASENANNVHCPSVSYLFRSVAKHMGNQAVGILLTGMGRDGADGLKEMKDSGSMTIVQDEESSIVYGMPGEALALDAANVILTPPEIAQFINKLNIKKS